MYLTFESTPYLLLIPYLNLYAVMDGTRTIKRLMSISHIEQDCIDTLATITKLNARVSLSPDM